MHAASGTLVTPRLGRGCDTLAYIRPWSWRKLGLDALLTPKAILGSHASDQSLKLSPDRRATTSFLTRRPPPPVRPPVRSLPAQNCFRFHNQQRTTPIAEPSTCQNPKASIGVAQARPRMPTLQHH